MKKCPMYSVTGVDGTGKTSVMNYLTRGLAKSGLSFRKIDLPKYFRGRCMPYVVRGGVTLSLLPITKAYLGMQSPDVIISERDPVLDTMVYRGQYGSRLSCPLSDDKLFSMLRGLAADRAFYLDADIRTIEGRLAKRVRDEPKRCRQAHEIGKRLENIQQRFKSVISSYGSNVQVVPTDGRTVPEIGGEILESILGDV